MKVRLIQPAQLNGAGHPTCYDKIFMPSGTLATLAALTPPDVDVAVTDEYVDSIDFDEGVDVVGITALTPHAPRAYQIADEFRKRGRTVVMGGVHASALPDEALQHVDSVVRGEAENQWERVLRDFQGRGRLDSVYETNDLPDLRRLVVPRFDLTNYDRCLKAPFARTPAIPVFTTRGCPFNCKFCSVTRFFGGHYRTKPVENVIREIESSGAKDFFFVDDNIAANPEYAEQLFRQIAPLKIRWFSQVSTTVVNHPKLVELMGESGCHEVILGVESIDAGNLASINKGFNKIERYPELFRLLKQNGISPHVSIIFGMDNDDEPLLRRTLDFLMAHDVMFFRISVATPYPGTDFYRGLESEGRITERDWSKYDLGHVVFRPLRMTAEALVENQWRLYDEFYSYGNIARRLWKFREFYRPGNRKCSFLDDALFQVHFHLCTKKRRDPYSGILAAGKNGSGE